MNVVRHLPTHGLHNAERGRTSRHDPCSLVPQAPPPFSTLRFYALALPFAPLRVCAVSSRRVSIRVDSVSTPFDSFPSPRASRPILSVPLNSPPQPFWSYPRCRPRQVGSVRLPDGPEGGSPRPFLSLPLPIVSFPYPLACALFRSPSGLTRGADCASSRPLNPPAPSHPSHVRSRPARRCSRGRARRWPPGTRWSRCRPTARAEPRRQGGAVVREAPQASGRSR